ncbi:MAG TPA: M17 family peptidase N-terminal domain-containing protein [Nitrospiria bacterium]|nr:M17 family peptidase N-terminal domain-containing protein [Nitrospiria bacterium]HUK55661.1 M17 family peptidase N-terminal domain-containing protein [Nitrospiria bacterium]
MSPIKVLAQKVTKVNAEMLVAGFFQDDRPLTGLAAELDWIYNGILSRLILRDRIRGGLKETTLLAAQRKLHAHKVLIIGLGKRKELTQKVLHDICSHIGRTLSQLHIKDCAIELFGQTGRALEDAKALEVILESLRADPDRPLEMSLLVSDEEKAQRVRQHVFDLIGSA